MFDRHACSACDLIGRRSDYVKPAPCQQPLLEAEVLLGPSSAELRYQLASNRVLLSHVGHPTTAIAGCLCARFLNS